MSVTYERERKSLSDKSVWLSSKTTFEERVEFYDVTGPVWNVFHVRVLSGTFQWKTVNETVSPPSNEFGLFLPRHSLGIDIFDHAEVELVGLYSNAECPVDEKRPYLFEIEKIADTAENLEESLKNSKVYKYVDYNSSPEEIASAIKMEVDQNLKEGLKLSEIAEKLGKHQSTLSREFKSSFGMSPKQYQTMCQMVYGEFLLGIGWEINDVIFEVGFKDFSRFYKQFKGKFNDTPNSFLKSKFK